MLKISQAEASNHGVTLKLEGRVVGPWVEELRQACDAVLMQARSLKLDLAEVEFADSGGVAVLCDLRTREVAFTRCPPFIEEQLKNSAAG